MMAKSLVRNRHTVNKLFGLRAQLQGVSLRIQVRVETTLERPLAFNFLPARGLVVSLIIPTQPTPPAPKTTQ